MFRRFAHGKTNKYTHIQDISIEDDDSIEPILISEYNI